MAKKSAFNPSAHGLRGVASLMVFYAHILGGTADHIYANDAYYTSAVQGPWSFGVYGVNLFFTISGFVIYSSVERYAPADFAFRRFVRIYPLFLFFSLVFVALNALTNAYPATNNLHSILAGLLFLDLFTGTEQLTPNAWSLTYEVIYYALASLTFHFAIRNRNPVLGSVAVAASAAFLFAYPITFYFVGGMLVAIASRRASLIPAFMARSLEIGLAVACIWLGTTGHIDYTWTNFANPLVPMRVVATIAYFYFAVQPGSVTEHLLGNRAVAYFGTVSYSLYLLHPYTYYIVRAIFSKLNLFSDNVWLSIAIFAVVTSAVTIPLTHLVNIWLERTPYRKVFGQNVFHGRKQPQGEPAAAGTPMHV